MDVKDLAFANGPTDRLIKLRTRVHNLNMVRHYLCVSLLPLWLLIFGQSSDQNYHYVKQWTERHASYLSEPTVRQTQFWLHVWANSPRPLDDVLTVLAGRFRWHINYEDPRYARADLVDDTAPVWLQGHPGGLRVYTVAGGAFHTKTPVDGVFPGDPSRIIPAIVEAYNGSGNPGRFELRTVNHDSFDIVPTAAADGPQTPLLDTVMSFDATDTVSAPVTLRRFCEKLSRESGQTVIFGGFDSPSENRLDQARIEQHSQNQPAREIVRQMYRQVGSTDCWRLLYDPDSNKFWLQMR